MILTIRVTANSIHPVILNADDVISVEALTALQTLIWVITDRCVPINNVSLILSATLTLNWYWRPSCSPDTTPEEALTGKVSVPLTPPTVV